MHVDASRCLKAAVARCEAPQGNLAAIIAVGGDAEETAERSGEREETVVFTSTEFTPFANQKKREGQTYAILRIGGKRCCCRRVFLLY